MSSDTCPTDPRAPGSVPAEPLDIAALITQNTTALPEVYDAVYTAETTTPPDISSRTGLSRQVIHQNLERLLDVGLVSRSERSYRLVEPALPPTVVQSVAELGSPLRLELCAVAVDQDRVDVAEARQAVDRSPSNTRKILNALAEDGYLGKRASIHDGGHLLYRPTEDGISALESLEDPTAYHDQDGAAVTYHATGIEGTAFRTAYEVEDTHFITRQNGATVSELLAATDKEEKATRRRLDDLAQRGLLTKTRRRAKNVYRPLPRTRTMVETVRACDDERRLRAWNHRLPETCRERLPDPFFPTDVFEVLSTVLHEPRSDLADEFITKWKAAGLIDGNRTSGFRISPPDDPAD